MTTTLMPPGLDLTPNLEAWLRGEAELPCEIYPPLSENKCGARGEWIGHFETPDCGHGPATVILCDYDKEFISRMGALCGRGGKCREVVRLTFIDRLVS